jgi:hypothetical protein
VGGVLPRCRRRNPLPRRRFLPDLEEDGHPLAIKLAFDMEARAAGGEDPLLGEGAYRIVTSELAAKAKEGVGRKEVALELVADDAVRQLIENSREADTGSRLEKLPIESVKDEGRLEGDEGEGVGRVRFGLSGLAEGRHMNVEIDAAFDVLAESKSVLVVAKEPAHDERGEAQGQTDDQPGVLPSLWQYEHAVPLLREGVRDDLPRIVRLLDD